MIQQINHYKIKDFLGQGAMGVVYSADDGKFLREVAVKILRTDPFLPQAQQEKQRKALKRFEREAMVVASLQHYAIVPVYDFGQATVQGQDYPYMVMRLMAGGSLEKRLLKGGLPVEEVVRIMSWLAPALDKVHQQDIIHRDLKPANILFDEDELPALADFGIAKLTQATQITNSRAILGTPAYMSPEQTYRKAHRKAKLNGRSDIYALGAILYEMLTGKRPYHEAMDVLQVMYCHRMEPVPRLDELRTDLGAGWQALIDKAMAKLPDERYATAGELAAALKALTLPPPPPPPPPPPSPPLTAATHLEAGNQYYQQGDYDSAMAEYSRALLLDSNYSYGYLNRAVIYHVKGQFNKAIPDYNQAIRLNASDPKGYNYRGLAFYNMGQLSQAIRDYDDALRLKPDYSDATKNQQAAVQALTARAQASYQQGRLDEVIADCTTLLRLNPRDVTVLVLRGEAYEKQGRSQQAIADYNKALHIKPNHKKAIKNRQALNTALRHSQEQYKKTSGSFTSYSRIHQGQVAQLNEDSVHIERRNMQQGGELFVVADGMGGPQFGEVASQQAIKTIKEVYYQQVSSNNPPLALKTAIEEANRTIYQRGQQENRSGMGTTVVAAVRLDDFLHYAHVGDSRLYIVRNGQIKQLTHDHSLVAEQVAAGILSPEEAENHPHRNVISRAVGTSARVLVELAAQPIRLQDGDALILCSDGLTEHVKPDHILHLIQGQMPEKATQTLINAANAGGGSDNISVIVLQVGKPKAAAATTVRRAASAVMAAPPQNRAHTAPSGQAKEKKKRGLFSNFFSKWQ